jgi:hypothetical protein
MASVTVYFETADARVWKLGLIDCWLDGGGS